MRGTILITATMVSIDLHIHQATGALSVSGASRKPHLPESMVVFSAGQVGEGYFVPTCFSPFTGLNGMTD
jgi:hypothetical protein